MKTEELLRELARRKLLVSRKLVERIVEAKDSPELIVRLADELDEVSDGWFSVHSMFILSRIGSREAFDALVKLVTTRDLEEWTVEDLPYLFARFENCEEELEKLIKSDADEFVRLAAFEALIVADRKRAERVAKWLLEKESEICVFLYYIATLGDEFKEKAKKLVEKCEFLSEEDLEEAEFDIVMKDPWEHFNPENLLRLYKINYGKLKMDKYEPCFCESGKKFKHCCYEVWKKVKSEF